MKKLNVLLLAVVLLGTSLTQQSCIGSFQLTRNLYSWNMDIDGRWGSELVFLAMIVIPVYTVTLLADGVVLNSIEFWTGNNPLAMHAMEKQTRIVKKDGDSYKLTAKKIQSTCRNSVATTPAKQVNFYGMNKDKTGFSSPMASVSFCNSNSYLYSKVF